MFETAVSFNFFYLESFVSVSHDTNKRAQYQVNEQRNENVQVDLAEHPYRDVSWRHKWESREHVVTIHKGVQTFCRRQKRRELKEKKGRKRMNNNSLPPRVPRDVQTLKPPAFNAKNFSNCTLMLFPIPRQIRLV